MFTIPSILLALDAASHAQTIKTLRSAVVITPRSSSSVTSCMDLSDGVGSFV